MQQRPRAPRRFVAGSRRDLPRVPRTRVRFLFLAGRHSIFFVSEFCPPGADERAHFPPPIESPSLPRRGTLSKPAPATAPPRRRRRHPARSRSPTASPRALFPPHAAAAARLRLALIHILRRQQPAHQPRPVPRQLQQRQRRRLPLQVDTTSSPPSLVHVQAHNLYLCASPLFSLTLFPLFCFCLLARHQSHGASSLDSAFSTPPLRLLPLPPRSLAAAAPLRLLPPRRSLNAALLRSPFITVATSLNRRYDQRHRRSRRRRHQRRCHIAIIHASQLPVLPAPSPSIAVVSRFLPPSTPRAAAAVISANVSIAAVAIAAVTSAAAASFCRAPERRASQYGGATKSKRDDYCSARRTKTITTLPHKRASTPLSVTRTPHDTAAITLLVSYARLSLPSSTAACRRK